MGLIRRLLRRPEIDPGPAETGTFNINWIDSTHLKVTDGHVGPKWENAEFRSIRPWYRAFLPWEPWPTHHVTGMKPALAEIEFEPAAVRGEMQKARRIFVTFKVKV